jgi:oligogalacturonide lyase
MTYFPAILVGWTMLASSILVPCETGSARENIPVNRGDENGVVGKVFPSEKKTWIDDTTGCEITQWTSNSTSHHPYFTIDAFINDSTAIIFSSRTGKEQLYTLNLTTGTMVQITDAEHLREMDHLPAFKTIWYLDSTKLFSLNTTSLTSRLVYDFAGRGVHVGSFSVTCDARYMVFSANKKEATATDWGYGPYAIFKLDLRDTTLTQITMDYGFNIGHVQANPVDPDLVLYCWQWEAFGRPKLVGHAPIRIWWVSIDGLRGGPLAQEYGTQRTHETWTADGKCITYVSKYRWGPKLGTHFLGIQSIDGSVNATFPAQVSPAHQNLFKDNRHWIVDQFNTEQPLLVMFTRDRDKLSETKILFRHGSSWKGQASHPHPRFSTDGTYVLFSTDRSGLPQVYTVRVGLSGKDTNRKSTP